MSNSPDTANSILLELSAAEAEVNACAIALERAKRRLDEAHGARRRFAQQWEQKR